MSTNAEFFEYTTKQGDRWDNLSWEFYGDAKKYEPIVVANPDVPIVPILTAGITLRIPIIDELTQSDIIASEDLPPWLRPA
ncbi:MAG: tail protein X [Candidatus Abawacabacteria bacterium]|nr:tail protein X [Candidatus Abawacabacteria bacterium]